MAFPMALRGLHPCASPQVGTLARASYSGSGGLTDLDDLGREQPVNPAFDVEVSLGVALREGKGAAGCSGFSLWHRPVNHLPPEKGGYRRLSCASVRRTVILMDTKTKRWTLRVTPAQDTIVRRVLSASGMSLSEYVVGRAVASAVEDLADRQVFAVSGEAWEKLQKVFERPATAKPKIAALLAEDSVLDSG